MPTEGAQTTLMSTMTTTHIPTGLDASMVIISILTGVIPTITAMDRPLGTATDSEDFRIMVTIIHIHGILIPTVATMAICMATIPVFLPITDMASTVATMVVITADGVIHPTTATLEPTLEGNRNIRLTMEEMKGQACCRRAGTTLLNLESAAEALTQQYPLQDAGMAQECRIQRLWVLAQEGMPPAWQAVTGLICRTPFAK